MSFVFNYAQEYKLSKEDSLLIFSASNPSKSWVDKLDIEKIKIEVDSIVAQNTWINAGYLDFDIKEIYQSNDWEGSRFGIGARTSYKFHPKIQFNGRLNYGTDDKKFIDLLI